MQTLLSSVKKEFVKSNVARHVLLAAMFALFLCPLSAFAQSCPGSTSWNGGTGNWETAGNWSAGVPGATSSACINAANSTVNVTATSGDTTLNLDINLGTDILNIGNNTQLTIASGGNILNNGALNLNSGGNNTELIIAGATTLSGTGTLTMSNNTNNFITGGGTFTNKQTIQGAGNIGNNNLTLINNGTIDANVSSTLQINPNGGTTNTGTLEATAGGTLELSGSTVANTGGLILATGTSGGMSPTPSVVELNNVSITGGTLTSSSGGVIESVDVWNGGSTPTLTNVTISTGSTVNVPNNDGLNLGAGTITNNGTINLQSGGNTTELVIAGNTTLAGTGTVTMSNNTNNLITGGGTLTNNETIQGAGFIGNNDLTLINNGTIDANVSTVLQVNPNGGTTNKGTMEATAGGTLELSGSTVANAGGLIQATGTGSTVQLNDVIITGGTLTSSSGGAIVSANVWNTATPTLTGVTISAGTVLDIPNNNGLNISGTITNGGTINLQSGGNNTQLVITGGNVTLTGGGNVTMSDNTNNVILAGTAGLQLTNVNNTISGSGNIGNGNMAFVNDAGGTVDATSTHGNALTITTGTNGATNLGLFEATAGGTLQLENTITNTGGTILATGTGALVDLNNTSITGGTLTSNSGGAIQSTDVWNSGNTPTLTNVTISTGSTLNVPNNNGLNLGAGIITNNGTINLQSNGNNTELVIAGATTLAGSGTVMMSNNANNLITGGGTLTNNETIQGAGSIGNGDLMLINNGTIDANVSSTLQINPNGGTTNNATMEATAGGTLELSGSTVANGSGLIEATGAGSTVQLNDVSITGGTLTSGAGASIVSTNVWNSNSTSTLTGLTISSGTNVNVLNNNGLNISGTITNNGNINLQSNGNDTQLVIAGTATLSGSGTVTMSNNTNNQITGGGTLTNKETIQGSGNVGNNNLNLVNSGTIDADQSASLTIQSNLGNTNTGKFEATSGGQLILDDSITNTGGTILATGTGSAVQLNDVSINGGTLTSSSGGVLESVNVWNSGNTSTLSGVTISAGTIINIPNNNGLNLAAGTITNKGTINLQSGGNNTELFINGAVTLASTGKVVMSANSNNLITGSSGSVLTNQNTIEGEGNIGGGQIGVDNSGTIEANATKAPFDTLIIDASSAGFSNNVGTKEGTLSVSKSNVLDIEGTFNNFSGGTLTGGIYKATGTLEFAAGSGLVTNDAAITLTGTGEILNTSNNTNALTQFADNGSKGTFTLASTTFTDANVFTNSGTIAVGTASKFDASDQLTNFNSATSTLTGGSYTMTGTGQLQFNNQGDTSDIVTNDAKITLAGVDTTKSSIIDQTGANALANFAANGSSGSLILTTDRNFSTPGNFSNAGIVTVSKSTGTGHTQLTIGATGTANYTQTGGTTTVDGLLTTTGAINIQGGFVYGNLGTITGAFDLTGGTLNPGDGIKKEGTLNIAGNYTETGSGILNIDLDGTVAGTKYDVLNISGTAALGGTLDFDLISTFKPTVGETFDVINYSSETGSFTTVNLPTAPAGDHWTFACGATDCTLTLNSGAAGPAAQKSVPSAAPAKRVSPIYNAAVTAGSMREPSAILTRAETCGGFRTFASLSCVREAISSLANVGVMHAVASHGTAVRTLHNNVATVAISGVGVRTVASHTSTASATSMARLYMCAYMPESMTSTMGCR